MVTPVELALQRRQFGGAERFERAQQKPIDAALADLAQQERESKLATQQQALSTSQTRQRTAEQELAEGESKATRRRQRDQLTEFSGLIDTIGSQLETNPQGAIQQLQQIKSTGVGTPQLVDDLINRIGSFTPENTGQEITLLKETGQRAKTRAVELAAIGTPTAGQASAVTKIFPDGTAVQALRNGEVQVKGPGGEILQGEDRLAALQTARNEEISQASEKAGAIQAAKVAIDASKDAFDKIAPLNVAIANIDEAIAEIDAGAKSGAVEGRLPSIRAASIRLDNLQKRLGLDVIQNTTFGALSESELNFALDAALPKGLDEPELRKWLVDKQNAQRKLADYLENVAVFLGTPGNTIPKWLEAQRELQEAQPATSAVGRFQIEVVE